MEARLSFGVTVTQPGTGTQWMPRTPHSQTQQKTRIYARKLVLVGKIGDNFPSTFDKYNKIKRGQVLSIYLIYFHRTYGSWECKPNWLL